jgi:hypothetical protein
MRRLNLIFILTAGSILACPPARATTLERLSLDQLAQTADAVARVRCASVESRWENGSIWTISTFQTLETFKGLLPAQVTVRVPGGRVGHLTETVGGTPRFSPGAEAVVFLERSPIGGFSVTAWVEGTFRIGRDPRTGEKSVTQDSAAYPVFDPATRSFHFEGIHRMPLAEFRQRVVAAVARAKQAGRSR